MSPKHRAPTTSGQTRPSTDGSRKDLRADCTNCFGLCCVALPFAAPPTSRSTRTPESRARTCKRTSAAAFTRACWKQGFPRLHRLRLLRRRPEGLPGHLRRHGLAAGAATAHGTCSRCSRSCGSCTSCSGTSPRHSTCAPARPVHDDLRRALDPYRAPHPWQRGTLAGARTWPRCGATSTPCCCAPASWYGPRFRAARRTTGEPTSSGPGSRAPNLRGANLRGAQLIAADLRKADLRTADLIGADFRDADLRGADLTGSIFLTQSQVNAARGDAATRLPAALIRPAHW